MPVPRPCQLCEKRIPPDRIHGKVTWNRVKYCSEKCRLDVAEARRRARGPRDRKPKKLEPVRPSELEIRFNMYACDFCGDPIAESRGIFMVCGPCLQKDARSAVRVVVDFEHGNVG